RSGINVSTNAGSNARTSPDLADQQKQLTVRSLYMELIKKGYRGIDFAKEASPPVRARHIGPMGQLVKYRSHNVSGAKKILRAFLRLEFFALDGA
ncbi:hypothetical protein, partial [Rhizobium etli]|uniref:hypothetical protein n=1 Tax=Rhizobium etli TaxID=29449 RepID=UPI001AEE20FC